MQHLKRTRARDVLDRPIRGGRVGDGRRIKFLDIFKRSSAAGLAAIGKAAMQSDVGRRSLLGERRTVDSTCQPVAVFVSQLLPSAIYLFFYILPRRSRICLLLVPFVFSLGDLPDRKSVV